ncbi:glycoside hydrolase family 127 protein [Balneolales bacterium ANBcel1]|nr:glycoside hydrolase family 127 protein [Balneolales bacterium ANBcel1]
MLQPFRWVVPVLLTAGALIFSACERSERDAVSERSPFQLSSVRITDGPFLHAQKLNDAYVLAHEPDRLLAPFLAEAGLEPRAERYGNWENSGLDGHTAGHYLSTLAMMVAASGNDEARERLEYMVDELARAQAEHGDGYVGGIPGSRELWAEIKAGNIDAAGFSLNGRWVPWYNIHKLYAGLRDAWLFTGNEQALEVLVGLSDWSVDLVADLSDDQIQEMLISEHGGMNEVFADVYEITGDVRYLELARQFSHREILDPLLRGEDRLTGLHANTQIPKVIGFQRVAEVVMEAAQRGDQEALSVISEEKAAAWSQAAAFFWETVVTHRSVAIGGNSVMEHFHPKDDFSSMLESREGPETCNTYNMMRLAKQLYFTTNELKYLDYYERALYNHILSSQHPEHGGLVYFSPMRPGHYRVYSNPEHTFWCCVGSGIENHTKYGELIYARDGQNLYVNLFITSQLDWNEKGVRVIQNTEYPESELTELRLEMDRSRSFDLQIRHPDWLAAGEMAVEVNGEAVSGESGPGSYFRVERDWRDGDRVTVHLPMETYGEYLPDGSPYMAVMHGPVVLAAEVTDADTDGLVSDDSRMGHIAHGPLYARENMPMLVIDDDDWAQRITPFEGEPLGFDISELIYPQEEQGMSLIPFYRLHDARYIVYWQTGSSDEAAQLRQELAESERTYLELEAQTIDRVAPGQQQPESDHNFQGEGTEAGIHQNRHWRHAEGWFSYDLNDPDLEAHVLRLTYYGGDSGRHFDIYFNGHHIAEVRLDGTDGDRFFDRGYAIPGWIVSGHDSGVHTVRFEAREGSLTAGIYDVRLMR